MHYILFVIVGMVSGAFGGMGMGGGTLLIPLLTIALGFNQKIAQGINLISFSVMALIIIFLHIKNGYINIKLALFFSLFALPFSILSAILANIINPIYLKTIFGILLMFVAVLQTYEQIKKQKIK